MTDRTPDAVERYEVGKSSLPSALNSTPIPVIVKMAAIQSGGSIQLDAL